MANSSKLIFPSLFSSVLSKISFTSLLLGVSRPFAWHTWSEGAVEGLGESLGEGAVLGEGAGAGEGVGEGMSVRVQVTQIPAQSNR